MFPSNVRRSIKMHLFGFDLLPLAVNGLIHFNTHRTTHFQCNSCSNTNCCNPSWLCDPYPSIAMQPCRHDILGNLCRLAATSLAQDDQCFVLLYKFQQLVAFCKYWEVSPLLLNGDLVSVGVDWMHSAVESVMVVSIEFYLQISKTLCSADVLDIIFGRGQSLVSPPGLARS